MADRENSFLSVIPRGCASKSWGREGAVERGLLKVQTWVLARTPISEFEGWEMPQ